MIPGKFLYSTLLWSQFKEQVLQMSAPVPLPEFKMSTLRPEVVFFTPPPLIYLVERTRVPEEEWGVWEEDDPAKMSDQELLEEQKRWNEHCLALASETETANPTTKRIILKVESYTEKLNREARSRWIRQPD